MLLDEKDRAKGEQNAEPAKVSGINEKARCSMTRRQCVKYTVPNK